MTADLSNAVIAHSSTSGPATAKMSNPVPSQGGSGSIDLATEDLVEQDEDTLATLTEASSAPSTETQDEELLKLIEASSILNLVELTKTALDQGLIQPQPKYN